MAFGGGVEPFNPPFLFCSWRAREWVLNRSTTDLCPLCRRRSLRGGVVLNGSTRRVRLAFGTAAARRTGGAASRAAVRSVERSGPRCAHRVAVGTNPDAHFASVCAGAAIPGVCSDTPPMQGIPVSRSVRSRSERRRATCGRHRPRHGHEDSTVDRDVRDRLISNRDGAVRWAESGPTLSGRSGSRPQRVRGRDPRFRCQPYAEHAFRLLNGPVRCVAPHLRRLLRPAGICRATPCRPE